MLTARGFSYQGAGDDAQIYVSGLTPVAIALPKVVVSPRGPVARTLHQLGFGREFDVDGNETVAGVLLDAVRVPLGSLGARSPSLIVEEGVLRLDTSARVSKANPTLALAAILGVLQAALDAIATG